MSGTHAIIDALRLQLKARNLKYADLAKGLNLSEPSVKRLFASRNCSLKRIDQICAWLGIEFAELTHGLSVEDKLLSGLSAAQEKEIVSNRKLLLVAVCLMNQLSAEEIIGSYAISAAECTQMMLKLDRIGIIDLLPNNRYRLRLARNFKWLPNGPFQEFFRVTAGDFFSHAFVEKDECFVLLNMMLTAGSIESLKRRLQLVAQDYAEQHNQDARAPRDARKAVSLMVAMRPWEPPFMRELVRQA